MHEKAALEISGASDKEESMELARDGALNFPILTSLRVAVSKKKDDGAPEHDEDRLNVIIMEATPQRSRLDLMSP